MKRYKDKDWLHEQYIVNKKSTYEIGMICNCSAGLIWYWLNKFDIKTRSHSEAMTLDSKKYRDKVWLYEQYVINRTSPCIIGKMCDASNIVIYNWLERFNIPRDVFLGSGKRKRIDVDKYYEVPEKEKLVLEFMIDYCKNKVKKMFTIPKLAFEYIKKNGKVTPYITKEEKEIESIIRKMLKKSTRLLHIFDNGKWKRNGQPQRYLTDAIILPLKLLSIFPASYDRILAKHDKKIVYENRGKNITLKTPGEIEKYGISYLGSVDHTDEHFKKLYLEIEENDNANKKN